MQRHWVILIAVVAFIAGLWIAPLLYRWAGPDTPEVMPRVEPVGQPPYTATPPGGDQPPTLSEHYDHLSPSVVNISILSVEQRKERYRGSGFDSFVPLRESRGSGVILTADGSVLTNHHVVVGAHHVQVHLADGQLYSASVVGTHEGSDLALLQIESESPLELQPAILGRSEALRVGEWVFAIGNPFGLNHSLTTGIVSYIGRPSGDSGLLFDYIQTDTPINPGNSGGPLFNMNGEVVGISSAILGNAEGIGFCIPIDVAKVVVPVLRERGEFHRGYLGVSLAPASSANPGEGVLVDRIFEDTPAALAGLLPGDRLLKFGKHPIRQPHDVTQVVGLTPPGTEVAIEFLRDGTSVTTRAVIGDYDALTMVTDVAIPKLGILVRVSSEEDRRRARLANGGGITITGVEPHGPAASTLSVGDVILELDGDAVTEPSTFATSLGRPGRHQVVVSRGGRVFHIWP